MVGSSGRQRDVLLITSGPWTATSNASWLQIAPGSASGVGQRVDPVQLQRQFQRRARRPER